MRQFNQRRQIVNTQVNAGGDVILNPPPLPVDEKRQAYNRERMLGEVQAICIERILKPSLANIAHIELGLQKQYGVTTDPWQPVLQEYERTKATASMEGQISQIYDQANGEVLILGEPGVGKTTLLLELIEELLDRAWRNDSHPIPTLFFLASWANKRQPLEKWFLSELCARYKVPRSIAILWLKTEQILPLLDGLDEVAALYRKECVEAINTFRNEHGLLPMVVCSRQTDYLALSTRLQLRTAILVQSLTNEQVEVYIASAGKSLEPLHQALEEDATLQALAHTPLMLNILSAVYLENASIELTNFDSLASVQRQVFAAYIQQMLKHHKRSRRYTSEQTIYWLVWLAKQLKEHNQVEFYIEHLQSDYLDDQWRWFYDLFAIQLPGVFIGIVASLAICVAIISRLSFYFVGILLVGGLLGALLSKGNNSGIFREETTSRTPTSRFAQRLLISLPLGLGIGLIADVTILLNSSLSNKIVSALIQGICWGCSSMLLLLYPLKARLANAQGEGAVLAQGSNLRSFVRKPVISNGLFVWLLVGLIYGGLLWYAYGPAIGMSDGVRYGLITGLIASFLSLLLPGMNTDIQVAERVSWSWTRLRSSLFTRKHIGATLGIALLAGVVIGLSYGLLSTAISVVQSGKQNPLFYILSTGLSTGSLLGLTYWLLIGSYHAVTSEALDEWQRIVPNQGIHRSAHNSLVVGLVSFVVIGAISVLCNELIAWVLLRMGGMEVHLIFDMLQSGVIIGLSAGLIAGLLNGGLAWLRHYVLRIMLYKQGRIPWDYTQFLDEAAQLMLLRRAGGRYFFLHHLLLDYFADLKTDQLPVEYKRTSDRKMMQYNNHLV